MATVLPALTTQRPLRMGKSVNAMTTTIRTEMFANRIIVYLIQSKPKRENANPVTLITIPMKHKETVFKMIAIRKLK